MGNNSIHMNGGVHDLFVGYVAKRMICVLG
jgi:hypothetical protein